VPQFATQFDVLEPKISFWERFTGGIQWEAVQIGGREQWRGGQLRQGEGRAEQQREWWQEAGKGHIEAPRAAQGLYPCPGEAR